MSECNYRTRMDGTLHVPNIHPNKVEALYQIKNEAGHMLKPTKVNWVVKKIEEELFKNHGYSFVPWLNEHREEIATEVKVACLVELDDDPMEASIKSTIREYFKTIFE